MRAVTVYRVDYGRKTKDPIGAVLEMRTTERAHNYHDLLRLARSLFASDTADALHIVIDVSKARGAASCSLNVSFPGISSRSQHI